MPYDAGRQNEQRQWPVPSRPWAMAQTWHDLLFMHWPVPARQLRPLVPAKLEIETFDGSAWIGVVPFRMSGIRLRRLPPIPGVSALPELNVRTYVRAGGKAGVWFFSLDAASAIAVMVARRWFRLPYFLARMLVENKPCGEIEYHSHRIHRGAPQADFRGTYRATGEAFCARHGTIEYFLTERYCLYAAGRTEILCGDIDHAPWPLQGAEAQVESNTIASALGIVLPETPPLLHFARQQDVRIWPLVGVREFRAKN